MRPYGAPMADSKRFFLREWRTYRRLSQDALAEKVGTSKGYLSQIERGERQWTRDWLDKFAFALDVAPETLLTAQPPLGAEDRGRGWNDAAPPTAAATDYALMAKCIEAAVEIIAPRRDFKSPEAATRAARDIAEAAVAQYAAYFRLIDEEKKSNAA